MARQKLPPDPEIENEEENETEEEEEEEEEIENEEEALEQTLARYQVASDALSVSISEWLNTLSPRDALVTLARRAAFDRWLIHREAPKRQSFDSELHAAIRALNEQFSPANVPEDEDFSALAHYANALSTEDYNILARSHGILKNRHYREMFLRTLGRADHARIARLRDRVLTPPELAEWMGGEIPASVTKPRGRPRKVVA